MSVGPRAAHLACMDNPESTAPDLNLRQQRFVDFAIRKSYQWEVTNFDPRIVVITHLGSDRQLVLYRSGATLTGMRVMLIDPSRSMKKSRRWLTQRDAWSMISGGNL